MPTRGRNLRSLTSVRDDKAALQAFRYHLFRRRKHELAGCHWFKSVALYASLIRWLSEAARNRSAVAIPIWRRFGQCRRAPSRDYRRRDRWRRAFDFIVHSRASTRRNASSTARFSLAAFPPALHVLPGGFAGAASLRIGKPKRHGASLQRNDAGLAQRNLTKRVWREA